MHAETNSRQDLNVFKPGVRKPKFLLDKIHKVQFYNLKQGVDICKFRVALLKAQVSL